MLDSFPTQNWHEDIPGSLQNRAIKNLEEGKILYFPDLAFTLQPDEQAFLSPEYADSRAKNISYDPHKNKLNGLAIKKENQTEELTHLLKRFSDHAARLIEKLFPTYTSHLIKSRTSFRPVQILGRKTSYRKDDARLHVDAFPATPNQGKRILRVFSNINPYNEDRVWRVGEPFEKVINNFLPRCSKPIVGKSAFLQMLKITKSYRTRYDHYMLQIHDGMKRDMLYQKQAEQREIRFPSGTTWVVQTDHVSHAAMSGQYVLEQTFYLPIHGMQNEAHSPLRVLEKHLQRALV